MSMRSDETPIVFRFPPEASHLRMLRRTVRDGLEAQGVPSATIELVVLVLDEVVSNSIEHGSSYRARHEHLSVSVRSNGIEVELDFEDPEAPRTVVDELADALERSRGKRPPPESERGRGLYLVADSLTELSVRPAKGGGLHLHGRCVGLP